MKMKLYSQPSSRIAVLILALSELSGETSAFGINRARSSPRLVLQMSQQGDDAIGRREALAKSVLAGLATASGGDASARALETYLTEPTDEFKESERQRAEFRRTQLQIKAKFNVVLTRLTEKSKTADEIKADLEELKGLVITTGGLPLGISRDDMRKIIRAKKAKGFWPTEVEYAYQSLNNEITYQQSPNRDKDIANPL